MYDSIDRKEIDQIHITTSSSTSKNILIDIRDKYEYILGNIKDSINIPYNYLALMPENYLNFNTTYYIYCNSGSKSRKLCIELTQLGYHVVDLIGGYQLYHDYSHNNY